MTKQVAKIIAIVIATIAYSKAVSSYCLCSITEHSSLNRIHFIDCTNRSNIVTQVLRRCPSDSIEEHNVELSHLLKIKLNLFMYADL